MKLVTFSVKEVYPRKMRIGAIKENRVIDLAATYRAWLLDERKCDENAVFGLARAMIPSDMTKFLETGDVALHAANIAIGFSEKTNESVIKNEKTIYLQDEINLHTPVPQPRSIRDFLLFEEHFRNSLKNSALQGEVPSIWYKIPIYYKGVTSTIIGPEDTCVWPTYSNVMDYELEFACVIGKRGKNISAENASDYIAGYTIFNDFSARDRQVEEMEGRLGPAKGKDFCTSIGPYLVTPDEIENVYDMPMEAKVNGETWSKGSTSTMSRTFEQVIEYVSQNETLLPGDILGSGTVGTGCGLELKRFLKHNDVVELSVGPLGTLRNRVVSS